MAERLVVNTGPLIALRCAGALDLVARANLGAGEAAVIELARPARGSFPHLGG